MKLSNNKSELKIDYKAVFKHDNTDKILYFELTNYKSTYNDLLYNRIKSLSTIVNECGEIPGKTCISSAIGFNFGFIIFTNHLDRDNFKDNIPANFINRGFIFTIE